MKNIDPYFIIERFLRTYTDVFSAKELSKLLGFMGVKMSANELQQILFESDNVFVLENNQFITRAGAFTGQYFSFIPNARELEQNLFVCGDRCMPFVDPAIISSEIKFVYRRKKLPRKIFITDCNTALDFYSFYGDEYASQYVASDPANSNFNLVESGFQLPSEVHLSGFSLEPVLRDCNFKFGDRILCRVLDWDSHTIEIMPLVAHKTEELKISPEDFERHKWMDTLEKGLLDTFDKIGPCGSMEEQLACTFFDNRKELNTRYCASLHEFLDYSKKVSMQLYGVETRLWRNGEDVPAVGVWNRRILDEFENHGVERPYYDVPDIVLDAYIKSILFAKKDIDAEDLAKTLVPEDYVMTGEEKYSFTLNIKKRSDIIRKSYNWFADFAIGEVRQRILDFYPQIAALVYKIDCVGGSLESFPQQELVTLSQMFSHVMQLIESTESDPQGLAREQEGVFLSLDGMELNFEEISEVLNAATEESHGSKFRLI